MVAVKNNNDPDEYLLHVLKLKGTPEATQLNIREVCFSIEGEGLTEPYITSVVGLINRPGHQPIMTLSCVQQFQGGMFAGLRGLIDGLIDIGKSNGALGVVLLDDARPKGVAYGFIILIDFIRRIAGKSPLYKSVMGCDIVSGTFKVPGLVPDHWPVLEQSADVSRQAFNDLGDYCLSDYIEALGIDWDDLIKDLPSTPELSSPASWTLKEIVNYTIEQLKASSTEADARKWLRLEYKLLFQPFINAISRPGDLAHVINYYPLHILPMVTKLVTEGDWEKLIERFMRDKKIPDNRQAAAKKLYKLASKIYAPVLMRSLKDPQAFQAEMAQIYEVCQFAPDASLAHDPMEVEPSIFSEQATSLQDASELMGERTDPQGNSSSSSSVMPPLERSHKRRKPNNPQTRASQTLFFSENSEKKLSDERRSRASSSDDETHPSKRRRFERNSSSVSSDENVEMEDVDQTNRTPQDLQKSPGYGLIAISSSLFSNKSQHPNARPIHPGQLERFAPELSSESEDRPMEDDESERALSTIR